MRRLRFVPDDTKIQFMRGRIAGLVVSAVLSTLSVILFFYPGLNYGIDFQGGIVFEVRVKGAADFPLLRTTVGGLDLGEVTLQEFGSPQDVLIRLQRQEGDETAQERAVAAVRKTLAEKFTGSEVRRVEVVGAKVSGELFRDGLLAVSLALVGIMIYIWFRFEWQFGVGAVVTLILDITKVVGFYAVTGLQFNLTSVAAILTIIGYSINDKVVVYDRMRENLRKFKTMPLRQLIDVSINETLSRTINTSGTTFVAMLPLALVGGEAVEGFALAMLFGIVVGTSSSIFIAAPILLFLGENKLRRNRPEASAKPAAG